MKERQSKSSPSDELAERIRAALGGRSHLAEIRMFGGICFTINGNMMLGTMKGGDLLARVGPEQEAEALAKSGARPMDFTGRPMKGFVLVAAEALDEAALDGWISMASAFVSPLPPKRREQAR